MWADFTSQDSFKPVDIHSPSEEIDHEPSSYKMAASDSFFRKPRTDPNKENAVAFPSQLYDRIKQRPRNATKKSPSYALQPKPTSQRPRPASRETTTNMSATPVQPAPPARSADSAVIDLVSPTTSSSAEPDLANEDPIPTTESSDTLADSDPPTFAGLVPPEQLSWTLKRGVDPECDSQPSPKRPCSSPSSRQREELRTATDQAVEQIEEEQAVEGTSVGATEELLDNRTSLARSSEDSFSSDRVEVRAATTDFGSRTEEDRGFMHNALATLTKQSKRKTANVGRRQSRRLSGLLKLARPPDESEALRLSGEEAKAQLQANVYFPGPIFTEGQQPLDLQTIDGFLSEQYDDEAKVWIQDPGTKVASDVLPTREITIGKLKEHFRKDRTSTPFKCLELAAHVEDGIRPAFLNTEDCRLLTKLKHPSSDDQASRRGYTPGWKEVEKWALLAKAGALIEPHQDSHGYSTYITVNQGVIGFGWLANPTPAQRDAWLASPDTFTAGEWRYAILRPGETVFFPAGTVHFVFRHASEGDTLAFGGRVLRCSQIVRWVRTLLEERRTGEITNEDLSISAPAYLGRVEKFVKQALKTGQAWKWGGEEAISEFLRLKAEFLGEE